MRMVVLLMALALAGCATTLRYTKPGGSDEEMQRTLAGCKVKQATAMAPAQDWAGVAVASTVRDNCMRAEGWVKTE